MKGSPVVVTRATLSKPMGKLRDLADKLKAVTVDDQEQALLGIISNHAAELIDLNTAQLFSGDDAQGVALRPYRSPAYAALKLSLNPAGVTDLKLTGSFYRGFFTVADRFPVFLNSNDPKTGLLAEKYGDIFGPTPKSKEEFRGDIKPEVQDYYRSLVRV